jgi:hypothetical protein
MVRTELHRSCSLDEQGSKPVADWLIRVAPLSPRILLVTGTGFPVNLNGVPRHRTGFGEGAGGVGVAKLNKSFQKRRGHVPPSVVRQRTNAVVVLSMTWGDIPGDCSRARAQWRGLCHVTRWVSDRKPLSTSDLLRGLTTAVLIVNRSGGLSQVRAKIPRGKPFCGNMKVLAVLSGPGVLCCVTSQTASRFFDGNPDLKN